jgi:hypothetical protein
MGTGCNTAVALAPPVGRLRARLPVRRGGGVAVAIERTDQFIFVCDQRTSTRCEERVATQETDFNAALRLARFVGWTVYAKRPGPGYIHCCPRCVSPR